MDIKKVIKESVGISFEVREWANILYNLLDGYTEQRLIVDGMDYPEIYEKFTVDYFVIDFNNWTNGYLDKTSGYDADGNYVVHLMVLEQFRGRSYMKTILNHEIKHAYQDWQRIRKGYPNIGQTKESKEMYTDDFVYILKDRIKVGRFFKEILKYYYLLSDLELNAFMENVYDNDNINDYKKMINGLSNFNVDKATRYENPNELQKDWDILKSLDLPFIKKYHDYISFLNDSTKYFKQRSEEILRRINKMEYVHRNR